MHAEYQSCALCAHKCKIDRTVKPGVCGMTDKLYVARAALHEWEEPPISGAHGSGAIFFSGCSLGCVYCQNALISRGAHGREIGVERLSEIMLELESEGAHNINLVTPTHFVPSIREALYLAKGKGLSIPIVYNTASYDTKETIKSLRGLVDIYIPDLKYFLPKTANLYSHAPDYPSAARCAISEMIKEVGEPIFDKEGIMKRGVIARILLLPSHLAEAKLSLKYLYQAYGDRVYISLMNQYTPMENMPPPLNRTVTRSEYLELLDYAEGLGVKNCFIQEWGTAKESFIPPFDNTGVLEK